MLHLSAPAARLTTRSAAAALALSLAAGLAADGHAAEQTALELAQALQRRYDGIRDFSADFVHTYKGGVLNKTLTERGHVQIKKPGRMRWDYTAPEPKQFVSDGVQIYFYIPADRQVIVSPVPAETEAASPALFLAGKARLATEFTPSLAGVPAGLPAGTRALKLVPKSRQPDYDWLVLAVDPATLAIRGLMTVDAQGGTSTFAFTNLKENAGLSDNQFAFEIPRGVDVTHASHP